MSKNAQKEIPADMWLHVATDALARYAAGGGEVQTAVAGAGMGGPAVVVVIPVTLDDARLSAAFVALFDAAHTPTEAAA